MIADGRGSVAFVQMIMSAATAKRIVGSCMSARVRRDARGRTHAFRRARQRQATRRALAAVRGRPAGVARVVGVARACVFTSKVLIHGTSVQQYC